MIPAVLLALTMPRTFLPLPSSLTDCVYVRTQMNHLEAIPDSHIQSGNISWLALEEVEKVRVQAHRRESVG